MKSTWSSLIGASFLVFMVAMRLWDPGTTITVSWLPFGVLLGGCLLILAAWFNSALKDKDSRIYRLVNKEGLTRGQRLRKATLGLCFIAAFWAYFSWSSLALLAQFLGGEPGAIPGVVIDTHARLDSYSPCRLVIVIRSDTGSRLEVCHHTGFAVWESKGISPEVPGQGKRLTVITTSNWAGVVAERLEF